jgi:hypothetical protein
MGQIGTFITIVVSLFTIIWTVYQYMDTKKREQDLKEFDNFHRLIKELVQPDDSNTMYVDRQTAIIYELRHFKRYYSYIIAKSICTEIQNKLYIFKTA